MSDMMTNINSTTKATTATTASSTASSSLTMDDFYQLMVAQFQNQDPTNPSDTGDYLNQMIQMAVVDAIGTITETSVTSYAASLVGKEVTVASYDSKNNMTEVCGVVTATGKYADDQIIIIDGKSYALSQIMAIGRLPSAESSSETDND
ncbi:MAG: flagellar hook capping FlgD N-terminal domain-containing protein [Anaerotignaceae bacterium]